MADASGGRTMRMGVGTIGVVGLAVLAAIFFRGGGGSGSGGTGSGSGTTGNSPSTQAMLPAQPQRPLRVTIRENDYVINERPVDLVTLTELAGKVPPGTGPTVMIERTGSSRARAEQDLKDALNKKQIPFASD
jgi:hypothetical protein